jgi:hypothetical protein
LNQRSEDAEDNIIKSIPVVFKATAKEGRIVNIVTVTEKTIHEDIAPKITLTTNKAAWGKKTLYILRADTGSFFIAFFILPIKTLLKVSLYFQSIKPSILIGYATATEAAGIKFSFIAIIADIIPARQGSPFKDPPVEVKSIYNKLATAPASNPNNGLPKTAPVKSPEKTDL